ncbi:magnesium transporter [Candidatus Microgenomates bacterium]|nr:magnesium transporter [Candidatus Microgenomates bacterium]
MRRRLPRAHAERLLLADDATEQVGLLLRLRLPWLIVGLMIGTVITFVISRFEKVLSEQLSLAFFIPIIVYMSDAVGTQTETIYVRNLSHQQAKFSIYFIKELTLGLVIGAISGGLVGVVAWVWLGSPSVAATVALAMWASITVAAIFALFVPTLLHKVAHVDPAVGAGPFTTVLQDLISLLIYFLIAGAIILG